MAFTREFIRTLAKESGVELPKEFEDGLVSEHLTARDAYAGTKVKEALEENKPAAQTPVKDSAEYKALEQEFNTFKTDVANKEAKIAKEKAVRAYFEGKNITGKNLELAIRGSGAEIAALEMDGETIKDTTALDGLVDSVFSDLVTTTTTKGAETATPPANNPTEKDPFLEGFDGD